MWGDDGETGELETDAGQPPRIPLPVPSGVGPASNVPRTMAGLAALAAAYGSLGPDAPADPGTVGEPSDAALEAAVRLDREDASGPG